MTSVAGMWARGFKPCIYSVQTNANAAEYSDGGRQAHRRKGGRCQFWVSREDQAERGLSICKVHWPLYLRDLEEDRKRRAALRAKYDPGPLPLED